MLQVYPQASRGSCSCSMPQSGGKQEQAVWADRADLRGKEDVHAAGPPLIEKQVTDMRGSWNEGFSTLFTSRGRNRQVTCVASRINEEARKGHVKVGGIS